MSRKFISLVLAGSLAVAGLSAAPARADANDVAKVLAGVAAIAVIGAAIKDNRKDRARTSSRGYVHDPYRAYRPAPKAYHHNHNRKAIAGQAYQRGYNDARRDLRNDRHRQHKVYRPGRGPVAGKRVHRR